MDEAFLRHPETAYQLEAMKARTKLRQERDDARELAKELQRILGIVCDEWYIDEPRYAEDRLPDWFTGQNNGRALWNGGNRE